MTTGLHFKDASLPAHPSPRRQRVGGGFLAFGVLGAPVAWALQFVTAYLLTGNLCGPERAMTTTGQAAHLSPALTGISVVALVIAVTAGWAAWRAWQETRSESHGSDSHHRLLEVGEGRTRFLAMSGMLNSVAFTLALLFTSVNVLLVPICG